MRSRRAAVGTEGCQSKADPKGTRAQIVGFGLKVVPIYFTPAPQSIYYFPRICTLRRDTEFSGPCLQLPAVPPVVGPDRRLRQPCTRT